MAEGREGGTDQEAGEEEENRSPYTQQTAVTVSISFPLH